MQESQEFKAILTYLVIQGQLGLHNTPISKKKGDRAWFECPRPTWEGVEGSGFVTSPQVTARVTLPPATQPVATFPITCLLVIKVSAVVC